MPFHVSSSMACHVALKGCGIKLGGWVCVTEFINMHASRLSWRFRLACYPVSPAFLTGVIRRKIRCDAARVEMRSAAHVAALDLTGKLNFQYPIA
jgi:hypothetical protein